MYLETIIENLLDVDKDLISLNADEKKNFKSIKSILLNYKDELVKFKDKKLVFGFYAGKWQEL